MALIMEYDDDAERDDGKLLHICSWVITFTVNNPDDIIARNPESLERWINFISWNDDD